MSDEQALYVRDGEAFVGTEATRGGWGNGGQSGGAVLALLGHVLEDVPTLAPMTLTRLTTDIVRPVPVGQPLRVGAEVVREGKRIQVVDLVVTAQGVEHTRARALRVRDQDLSGGSDLPPTRMTDDPRVRDVPGPEQCVDVAVHEGAAPFLRHGAELRQAPLVDGGLGAVWLRLRVPVVQGEPVRATSRAAMPMDCVNLIGVAARDLDHHTAINPDVSAHVVRTPAGEWTGMTGGTVFDHGLGHGVSMAVLRDERGPYGVVSTSQLVAPRG